MYEFIARNGVIAQNDSQVTGSLIVTNGITGSLFGTSSWAVNAITANTASYILNATSASFAATGSYADNFTVKNTLTAQTLVVSVVSSSVVYSSGSNIFGNSLTDTQKFTGSVQITGSLSVSDTITANANNFTSSSSSPTGEGLLISSIGATSGQDAYGSGILFSQIGTDNRRAAIIPVQSSLTVDADRLGLAFFTHPSSVGANDLVEQMRIISEGRILMGSPLPTDDQGSLLQVNGRSRFVDSVGIGTNDVTAYTLRLAKNITGSVNPTGFLAGGTIQVGSTGTVVLIGTSLDTAASLTSSAVYHYNTGIGTIGAGTSITTQYGYVASGLTQATNNYGFFGNLSAATGRWNLYMNGTANNYMAGNLGIGTTSLTGYELRVGANITGATTAYGIAVDGTIQSDVTSTALIYTSRPATAAASFNLGTLGHYYVTQGTLGAGSTIGTQVGFWVSSGLTNATTNYAFYSLLAAGTGRWNLYMEGTANNYMAGALGIGSTSVGSGINLNMAKTMTGATTQWNIYNQSQVQSDVTSLADYFRTNASTQAASFTLNNLVHYRSAQGTFGAGSTVNTQYGFLVEASLVGATTNYGFAGLIPSGSANNWNLYMLGTAPNYMAGSLGIGSTSLSNINLRIGKNISGSTDAYGLLIDSSIVSGVTANAYVFRSLPATVAASFTLTNLYHFSARENTIGAGSAITNQYGFAVESNLTSATNNYGFYGNITSSSGDWNLYINGTADNYIAGRLGLGTTGLAAKLDIYNNIAFSLASLATAADSRVAIRLKGRNTATNTLAISSNGDTDYAIQVVDSGGTVAGNIQLNPFGGSVGIGATALTGYSLRVSKNITGATTSFGVMSDGQIQSDVTSGNYFRTNASTAAASFTTNFLNHYVATQGTFGVGSNVLTQYGFHAASSLIGATTNYGFYGNIPSGTNRWNLYMDGTANNYLAGKLVIGTTTVPGSTLGIANNTEFSINLANIGTGGLSWQIASTSNTFTAGAGKLIFTYDGLSVNSLLTLEQATKFVGINKTNPSASLDVSGSALITGSLNVSNGITGSLFGTASFATTASYFLTGSVTSASYAETSSYADNFTVANTLTATTLVVQTVTSSVVYSSGSNIFGNSLSNTQQFTGSVTITGSLGVNTTSVTRTLTVNGSIFAGGVTTYNKSYNSLDTTGVAVAGLSAGSNGDSALFTFTCYGGLGYQRIVYSCRNESTTWITSKTIDEGANALDVLASVDGATITFTFRGRSALQQFRPSIIIEASGNSIDTTYL
jgi:hypothetical protein